MAGPRRCSISSFLLALLLLLGVGVVLTVGSSWACAVKEERDRVERLGGGIFVGGAAVPTSPSPRWGVRVPADWPASPDLGRENGGPGWSRLWASTAIPSYAADPTPQTARVSLFEDRLRVGLPFRSLQQWSYNSRLPTGGWAPSTSSPRITVDWAHRWLGVRELPIVPLWPGFALNTIFYAALAWGLWQVPLAIRRRLRRRKGKCVKCGYDRSGLTADAVCPECGTASPYQPAKEKTPA